MRKVVIGQIYKHFKGALVKVTDIALDSETLERMIIYCHLDNGQSWVRPEKMFLEKVTKDGKSFARFSISKTKVI